MCLGKNSEKGSEFAPARFVNLGSQLFVTAHSIPSQPALCTVICDLVCGMMLTYCLLKGDRVVGFTGNNVNTLVAMLAATSIGALWSGVSTDTGVHAVLERLRQIEPKILFADNGSMYNGKVHPTHSKIQEIAADLASLDAVVIFEAVRDHAFGLQAIKPSSGKVLTYAEFISNSKETPLEFAYLPPDHPVYILWVFSVTFITLHFTNTKRNIQLLEWDNGCPQTYRPWSPRDPYSAQERACASL